MLITENKFNPKKDIKPVDQFGFVDITKAFESGSIPASIAPSDVEFNGIDDPNSILGKPSDIFEARRMADYINENSSSGGASGSESSDSVPDEN